MATIFEPTTSERRERTLIARAEEYGFRLIQFETEAGQLVWEWRHGTDPHPQFVSRRVALHWMDEMLRRGDRDQISKG